MHCVLHNVMRGLFALWMGEKLTNDASTYVFKKSTKPIFAQIFASSRADIPSALGAAPRDPIVRYKSFKAAEWKDFILHWGTPLLYEHISKEAHANFRDLRTLFALSTKRDINVRELQRISDVSTSFVRGYEEIYYNESNPQSLRICTINFHSLLHISDHIRDCGPACYFWQYPMERFCGLIKNMARSKSHMSTSLANALMLREHLHYAKLPSRAPQAEQQHPLLLTSILNMQWRTTRMKKLRNHLRCPDLGKDELLQHVWCFQRCQPRQADYTFGSVASNRSAEGSRNNSRVTYHRSGVWMVATVHFYMTVRNLPDYEDGNYAYVQDVVGLHADKASGMVTYTHDDGVCRFVDVKHLIAPVGVMHEDDLNHRNRTTHMVVGAQDLVDGIWLHE